MSYILSVVYGLTIIIYIPLFTTVMERLRVAFPQVHSKIKIKVNLVFTLFLFLLFVRYAIYLSLQFASFKLFEISQLRAYLPFYISELIISIAYIGFLIRVYRNSEI
jgi:TRAP-type mannitol/chloroaromatic compound transport system permease small subunit